MAGQGYAVAWALEAQCAHWAAARATAYVFNIKPPCQIFLTEFRHFSYTRVRLFLLCSLGKIRRIVFPVYPCSADILADSAERLCRTCRRSIKAHGIYTGHTECRSLLDSVLSGSQKNEVPGVNFALAL